MHYAWKFARVKAGLPDAHFQRRAGHSSAAAALRYQHAADERDTEIAARLSALAKARSDRPIGSV